MDCTLIKIPSPSFQVQRTSLGPYPVFLTWLALPFFWNILSPWLLRHTLLGFFLFLRHLFPIFHGSLFSQLAPYAGALRVDPGSSPHPVCSTCSPEVPTRPPDPSTSSLVRLPQHLWSSVLHL
ncbi:hypothetical protein HJG60_008706 [Phyllostomus discolor]|uniref:Uncharacterized protein n=1 Tax=Phyllostomus discolor TaxID=89673 RepID=A0A833YW41_9CHIR|nr:hypothetical protein HJG60_008706 [Phyllostomus discolor]